MNGYPEHLIYKSSVPKKRTMIESMKKERVKKIVLPFTGGFRKQGMCG